MTKQEALRHVSDHVAGWLAACTFDEATGVQEDAVSDADADRLGWAVDEVQRRLYHMGGTT